MPEEPAKNKLDKKNNDSDSDVAVLHVDTQEPTAMTPDHEPREWLQNKPSAPRKKGPIIGLIVAVLVVLVGVAGWLGYTLWYQSPDKVLLDALINAGISKTTSTTGTWTSTGDGTNNQLKFDVKSGWKDGMNGTASFSSKGKDGTKTTFDIAAIHTPNGEDFLKLTNLKALVDAYFYENAPGSITSQARTDAGQEFYKNLLQPAVDKVDGKWVNVTPDDVKKISGPLGEDYECLNKTMTNLGNDTSKLIEIGTAYWNNTFITVKQNLGEKSGNFGYVVGIDGAKMKRFLEELKTTKFYQDLKACSSTFNLNPDIGMLLQDSTTRTEVWIDRWSHELRSIHSEDKTKMTLDMEFNFNRPITITKPTNAVVLSSVFSDFTQTFMNNYGSFSTPN